MIRKPFRRQIREPSLEQLRDVQDGEDFGKEVKFFDHTILKFEPQPSFRGTPSFWRISLPRLLTPLYRRELFR